LKKGIEGTEKTGDPALSSSVKCREGPGIWKDGKKNWRDHHLAWIIE